MRKTKYYLFSTGFVLLFIQILLSQGYLELEGKIKKITLDNGLRVLLLERHNAPVISFVTWANVGAVNVVKGITGIAHLFEHMAFKGTAMVGTKDIEKETRLDRVNIEHVTKFLANYNFIELNEAEQKVKIDLPTSRFLKRIQQLENEEKR